MMPDSNTDYYLYENEPSAAQDGNTRVEECVHGQLGSHQPREDEPSAAQDGNARVEECVHGQLGSPQPHGVGDGGIDGEQYSEPHAPENGPEGSAGPPNLPVQSVKHPTPSRWWYCGFGWSAFSALVGLLLCIALFALVGVETTSRPIFFNATATDSDELVLIGTTKLWWFQTATITTNGDLSYNQVPIWLADEEVTETKCNVETEAVSNYSGYKALYAYQNSNFHFEFSNLMGPPGYSVTLDIHESNNPLNQACVQIFGGGNIGYLTYSCEIDQTGYYDVTYVVSDGVSGSVTETRELVKLNLTFYNSSSIPSCVLDDSNPMCTLPDPPSSLPAHSTQYAIALIPSGLGPMFQISPEGRNALYAVPIFMSLCSFVALAGCCCCYHRIKKKRIPKN